MRKMWLGTQQGEGLARVHGGRQRESGRGAWRQGVRGWGRSEERVLDLGLGLGVEKKGRRSEALGPPPGRNKMGVQERGTKERKARTWAGCWEEGNDSRGERADSEGERGRGRSEGEVLDLGLGLGLRWGRRGGLGGGGVGQMRGAKEWKLRRGGRRRGSGGLGPDVGRKQTGLGEREAVVRGKRVEEIGGGSVRFRIRGGGGKEGPAVECGDDAKGDVEGGDEAGTRAGGKRQGVGAHRRRESWI